MLIKLLITMLLGFCTVFGGGMKPEDVISSITQEIINEIKSKPDLASGNLGSINQLVDKKSCQYLILKMTSLAVERRRSATESQKSRLMKVFRQLTFNLLGSIKFEQAKVQILPPRGKRNKKCGC